MEPPVGETIIYSWRHLLPSGLRELLEPNLYAEHVGEQQVGDSLTLLTTKSTRAVVAKIMARQPIGHPTVILECELRIEAILVRRLHLLEFLGSHHGHLTQEHGMIGRATLVHLGGGPSPDHLVWDAGFQGQTISVLTEH
jgi:hypothetical protein